MAFDATIQIGGIERDTPNGIAVTNGARDANLEAKLAIADGVAAFVDDIRAVGILYGLVGSVVVVAGDGFLAVGNGGCHQSLEIGEFLSVEILHVATETGDRGGLQLFGHGHVLHTLPVDTVNHDCLCGISQREGRVAQEHILELIHRAVLRAGRLVAIEQFHLGAAERFAHGYLLASVVCGKEVLGQHEVQLLIIIGIDGARRAYHGDSTASGVEHGHAPDVAHQMVVGTHLARGHNPQGQAAFGGDEEIFGGQDFGIRNLRRTAMARVVENQRALLHQFAQAAHGQRELEDGACGHSWIGIPEDALDDAAVVGAILQLGGNGRGIVHVEVFVAVVSQDVNLVFPAARLFVLVVVDGFVHKDAGLFGRIAEESADT